MLVSLAFKFSLWVGTFLAMFGDLRMTVLPLWWLLRACLSEWIGHLKFFVLFSFISEWWGST